MRGAKALMGPPDAKARKAAASVGAVDMGSGDLRRLAPFTVAAALREGIERGRADLFSCNLDDGTVLLCYNVYLWQGAGKCPKSRAKGDALFHDIVDDLTFRGNPRPSFSATSMLLL